MTVTNSVRQRPILGSKFGEAMRPAKLIVAAQSDKFDTDKRALEGACDLIRHSVHVKVLYIEKPNGDRFEFDAIKRWCDAQP